MDIMGGFFSTSLFQASRMSFSSRTWSPYFPSSKYCDIFCSTNKRQRFVKLIKTSTILTTLSVWYTFTSNMGNISLNALIQKLWNVCTFSSSPSPGDYSWCWQWHTNSLKTQITKQKTEKRRGKKGDENQEKRFFCVLLMHSCAYGEHYQQSTRCKKKHNDETNHSLSYDR